mgnify:CR=1 FL=1
MTEEKKKSSFHTWSLVPSANVFLGVVQRIVLQVLNMDNYQNKNKNKNKGKGESAP